MLHQRDVSPSSVLSLSLLPPSTLFSPLLAPTISRSRVALLHIRIQLRTSHPSHSSLLLLCSHPTALCSLSDHIMLLLFVSISVVPYGAGLGPCCCIVSCRRVSAIAPQGKISSAFFLKQSSGAASQGHCEN